MVRRSKWTASLAAGVLAGVAVLGIVAFGGSPTSNVSATGNAATDTPTPSPSPTPSPTPMPFAFTIACTPNPTTTGVVVTCTATQTSGTSGQAGAVLWQFGDGMSGGPSSSVMHTYTTAGSFTVSATAVLTAGGTAQAPNITEVVAAALMPKITANPTTANVGQQVTFTVAPATGTTFPTDTTFTWMFNDGTQSVSTNTTPSITHQFPNSGTFTVTVTATSVTGATNGTDSVQFVVTPQAQQLTLSFNPLTATAGTQSTFSVSATGNVPGDVIYTINWGDGTATSNGTNPTHTYANSGPFQVTVSTTSASNPGSNTTATFSVTVAAAQVTGPSATYGPGWNMVGGPSGTTFASSNGPIYTYQAGDTAYRSIPNTTPVQGGLGYWAFFTVSTTVALNGTGGPTLPYTGTLPPNQYVMVANPSNSQSVTVTGADVLYVYDTVNGYTATTTLKPGQGGWAFSASGGPISMH
ncbi:MAG: PKD domain-containing protein [Dehalococcoidia bacterium]